MESDWGDESSRSDSVNSSTECHRQCWHGECHNGTCMCEIRFDGLLCDAPNTSYFASFSAIFFLVGAVCLAQLVLCIRAEVARMKNPSLAAACRLTIQKTLYVVTGAAALLRALYFAAPEYLDADWVAGLLSAFYAVLLTGSSLIVCFWAEVFHLNDIRWDRPRFLSKSLLGFMTFNIITYSVLVAEIVITVNDSNQEKEFFSRVFTGCYALLLFVVIVFFLIYGVEVYFKMKGGFYSVGDATHCGIESLDKVRGKFVPEPSRLVNTSQLNQSRVGLVSQAVMLMVIVCFLFSDILGHFWKYKVTLLSRNVHDVVFRVVELGVALWFPCVLWNSISPERLWVLNPKQILRRLDVEPSSLVTQSAGSCGSPASDCDSQSSLIECWVCYESGSDSSCGSLIKPCKCSGSTSAVHHECLKRWLMECSEKEGDTLCCRLCGVRYAVESTGGVWVGRGLTAQHWVRSACLLTVMSVTGAAGWSMMRLYSDGWICTASVGIVLVVYYICLRLLGLSCVSACQRAKVSSLNILEHHDRTDSSSVCNTQIGSTNTPSD